MVDYRLAIDPGDIHVGWAEIRCLDDHIVVGEWTPNECVTKIRERLTWFQDRGFTWELILEEFVLYPGKSKDQAGSDMKTSQLIGVLKQVAVDFGSRAVMQGAHVKKPTRRQLRARRIKRKAIGAGIHASDAEEHLYHRHLRQKAKEENHG